jgi:hypothetical protein
VVGSDKCSFILKIITWTDEKIVIFSGY